MLSEGSTIRLSLRPWLLSPNSGCGEGGARVTSLVVLITSLFWLCLYQSPRLVAQHTAFQDLVTLVG